MDEEKKLTCDSSAQLLCKEVILDVIFNGFMHFHFIFSTSSVGEGREGFRFIYYIHSARVTSGNGSQS